MNEHILPDAHVVERARVGLEAVRQALRVAGRGTWPVYALRAVEVQSDLWILYVISPTTSLPLSRDLAAGLAIEPVWVSGRLRAWVWPLDFQPGGDGSEALYAAEIQVALRPRTKGKATGAKEGTSFLMTLIDAREGPGVRVTFAVPRRPLGWPP